MLIERVVQNLLEVLEVDYYVNKEFLDSQVFQNHSEALEATHRINQVS